MSKKTVEHDASGVPTAWLLVRAGPIELTKSGEDFVLTLTERDLAEIAGYHRAQGEKIPIDSHHFLSPLAAAARTDETEVAKHLPDGLAAMGFGSLELRADGTELWLNAVEWTPLAHELLKQKIFRYFSPVFRGLKDGKLRVTSVAMENETPPRAWGREGIVELATSADGNTPTGVGKSACCPWR